MASNLSILIRQIKYRKRDNRPTQFMLSHYKIIPTVNGERAHLIRTQGKGFGEDATIDRVESAFIKFLKYNYGEGEFSIVKCKGGYKGFQLFWRGIIKKDRFIRLKGSISPYLMTISPIRVWHSIVTKKEKK